MARVVNDFNQTRVDGKNQLPLVLGEACSNNLARIQINKLEHVQ